MPKLSFSLLFAYFSSRIIFSYEGKSKILASLTTYGLLTPKWKPLMLFLEVVYSSEQNCLKSVEEKNSRWSLWKVPSIGFINKYAIPALKAVVKLFSEIKRNDSPLSYKEKVKTPKLREWNILCQCHCISRHVQHLLKGKYYRKFANYFSLLADSVADLDFFTKLYYFYIPLLSMLISQQNPSL